MEQRHLPAFFRPNRNDARSPVGAEAGVEPSGAGVGRGGSACERPLRFRSSKLLLSSSLNATLHPSALLAGGLGLSMVNF